MNKLVQAFAVAAAMQLAAATAFASGTLTVTVPAGVTNSLTSAQIADIATADEFRKEGPGVLQITTELNAFTKTVTVAEGLLKVDNAGANALGPYDANDASSKIVVLSGSTSKAWICFTGDATIEKPVEVQPRSVWSGQTQTEWTGSPARHLSSESSGTTTYMRDISVMSYGSFLIKSSGGGTTYFNGAIRRHGLSQASFNISGNQKFYFRNDVDFTSLGHAGGAGEVHLDYLAMNLGAYSQASTGTTYFDRDYVFAASNTTFQCIATWGYVYLNGTRQAFGSIIRVQPGSTPYTNGAWLNNGVATPATFEFRQTVGYTNSAGQITGNIDFSKSGEATYCQNYKSTAASRIEIVEGTFEFGPECTWTGCTNIYIRGTGRLQLDRSEALSPELSLSITDTGTARIAIADNVQQQAKAFWVEGQRLPAGTYGGRGSSADYKLDCFDDGFTGVIRVMPESELSWNGGSGEWSDPAKWTSTGSHAVPQAGDAISISSGSVLLDAETPELYSVNVTGGTLVFSNWTTRLRSRFVTVGDGGVVTCAGPFTNDTGKCRVWIACEDLAVLSGGAIDVSEKGWSGGLKSVVNYSPGYWEGCTGWGPGAGRNKAAASHGGRGAYDYQRDAASVVNPYDDWTAPVEPGSGGFMKGNSLGNGYTDEDAAHGGGAVKIDATGTVTVDGTVSANGRGTRESRGLQVAYRMQNAGSGGSVFITCATIAGSGAISANGGDGDLARRPKAFYNCDYWHGYAAGGGCIAIHYDAARQNASAVAGMKISAKYGMYPTDTQLSLTTATIDKTRCYADLGTLHFTDALLVKALYGKGLCGKVVDYPEPTLEFSGDLDYTWGDCRIEREGLTVRIGGNLSISGADARMEVGAVTSRLDSAYWRVWAGSTPSTLDVTGNLTVSGKGALDVRAAETASPSAWGAAVQVGGDMTIGANGYVYAWSDALNLGSPHFTVDGDFTVAATGVFSADWRGGSGTGSANIEGIATSGSLHYRRGFGPGSNNHVGASHGGQGGRNGGSSRSQYSTDSTPAAPYDDPYLPYQAGSGGGYCGYGTSGCGGGLIHLVASGSITINGTVTADGYVPVYAADAQLDCQSAGSGGTVFLAGDTFSGTGTLSAKGGNSQKSPNADRYSGAGGGGRIAVWTGGELWNSTMNVRRLQASATPALEGMDFSGTATAAGGKVRLWIGGAVFDDAASTSLGGDGTVWFCRLKPLRGIRINFR